MTYHFKRTSAIFGSIWKLQLASLENVFLSTFPIPYYINCFLTMQTERGLFYICVQKTKCKAMLRFSSLVNTFSSYTKLPLAAYCTYYGLNIYQSDLHFVCTKKCNVVFICTKKCNVVFICTKKWNVVFKLYQHCLQKQGCPKKMILNIESSKNLRDCNIM